MTATDKRRILVVDDEPSLRFVLTKGLTKKGYSVDAVATLAEARQKLSEGEYFCVFLDINLPDGAGFELLEETPHLPFPPAVVVMTAEATMKNAIEAMQKGAFDYLTKPFDLDDVGILVERIIAYRNTEIQASGAGEEEYSFVAGELVGRAPAMQEVFKVIGRAANSDATALITGPTGSGKELVAQAFHKNSSRRDKPFITVNCAAIPRDLLESELFGHAKGAFTGAVGEKKGKFAQADGGVIMLDEVGELPTELQAKFLRVLQEQEFYPVGGASPVTVDVRIVAATNRDLAADVACGRFREDLYHRLNVVSVKLPPLDERREDIPLLVSFFLAKIAVTFNETPKRAAPEVIETLSRRRYPGNVRELENLLRRAVLMAPGEVISMADIDHDHDPSDTQKEKEASLQKVVEELMDEAKDGQIYSSVMGEVEKKVIEEALKRSGDVQAKAAKLLGMNRNTFMKRIAELGVTRHKK